MSLDMSLDMSLSTVCPSALCSVNIYPPAVIVCNVVFCKSLKLLYNSVISMDYFNLKFPSSLVFGLI